MRACRLIVSGSTGDGLDLSNLRIVFKVTKTDAQTPNTAEITVYNLAAETATQIKEEFTEVLLQAGYKDGEGVIFRGSIKQARIGRESGTDTYLSISAGDGDQAYNFAVVNATLAAGSTQADQIAAASAPMTGISQGYIGDTGAARLPRGKVMYGMSRDYLRQTARATDTTWSIQDGKLQIVPLTGVLPTQAVVINSKTGMIGAPEQTTEGVKVKALLNPLFAIGGKVQINEQDVQEAKIETAESGSTANSPAAISKDGIYRIISIEHTGDTRGTEWYSDLTCLDVDATAPENSQVKKNG
jgi:hypothetical protein